MHCASLRDGRCFVLLERRWRGVFGSHKNKLPPPKKKATLHKGFVFFGPKTKSLQELFQNIFKKKTSRMFFFQAHPPFKKLSIMIHLSKKSQKRILPKCRLRFPAAHDLESWFSVVGLRVFSEKKLPPGQLSVTSHRAEAKQFTLLLVKTVCYAFGFIGFRSLKTQILHQKKWWSQRDV